MDSILAKTCLFQRNPRLSRLISGVALLVHFEQTQASGPLEHWFSFVAPFALGVRAWSVGSTLAAPAMLRSLWASFPRLPHDLKKDKPPFVILSRPPIGLQSDVGAPFVALALYCRT